MQKERPWPKVAVVGIGALGSHVVLLARNWKAKLRVIDGDKVEQKNVLAQMHSELGKGRNKAAALKVLMQGMFRLEIEAFPVKVNEWNLKGLLGEMALIIDCTDNVAARNCIKSFALKDEIPCLHVCLSADGMLARVVWAQQNFKADKESGDGATCEDGANVWFHAMAAALVVRLAQQFLLDGRMESWMLAPAALLRIA
jgi:hypothetical protein